MAWIAERTKGLNQKIQASEETRSMTTLPALDLLNCLEQDTDRSVDVPVACPASIEIENAEWVPLSMIYLYG